MRVTKEEILENIRAHEWDIQGFNAYPLYLMCAATGSGWLVKQAFGVGYSHFFYLFSKGRARMYYDHQDWERICDAYYKKIRTRSELEALIGEYESVGRICTETAYELGTLETMSTKELLETVTVMCDRLTHIVGSAHAIEGITYGSEMKLRTLLTERGGVTEQEFGLICSPIHRSFLAQAQDALRNMRSLPESEIDDAIDDFNTDYGWIENTYLGRKSFSHADVVRRIKEVSDVSDNEHEEEVAFQKEKMLRRFVLSEQERFIIETIECCFHWQDERKKFILKTIEDLDPVVEEAAERTGIDAIDLKFAFPEELTETNLSDESFRSELKNRRAGCACYATPDGNRMFTSEKFEFFAQNLHVGFDEAITDIRGTVASPGIIVGTVRVCESVSDIDRVSIGEILVASMTRPEYLPAMQRASAIVTDEGGITCHAAIIAREMKKPCIIGTLNATKILKDGDIVKVDADAGIVRIIR